MKLPYKIVDNRGKEYIIRQANPSGGSAGKNNNKTSTIYVIYNEFIVKRIRYDLNSFVLRHGSKSKAIIKALCYCVGSKKAMKIWDKEINVKTNL